MPRHKQTAAADGRECKIRKRGCSSSSSSSLVRNYRLKRAILVGKRIGSSTPVPTWKMGSRSPSLPPQYPDSSKYTTPLKREKEISVSARKLAATLWEINEMPPSRGHWESKSETEMSRERSSKPILPSQKSNWVLPRLSDPSHDHERTEKSKAGNHMRRGSTVTAKLGALDSFYSSSTIEIETESHARILGGHLVSVKNRLKDVSNGLTASKELLKVLNRILCQEERHSSSKSVVSALRFELDRARVQVEQLTQEERSNRHETQQLLSHFCEEKAAWKRRERDKIHNAISLIAGELEVEKKLRRQTERLNKKLGKELADTKTCLAKAVKEVESEKRAKEILEQVCDELATGIGEDRATVEELKRESSKVREEVEKEREMLQLADVLREERVQMKLTEAKYEFEEKNAAVDRLRSELEDYLSGKRDEEKKLGSPSFTKIRELEDYLRRTLGGGNSCETHEEKKKMTMKKLVTTGKEKKEESDSDDDSSADSDLHSIELSMDSNSKRYNWNFCSGDGRAKNQKKTSAAEEVEDGSEWKNFMVSKTDKKEIESGSGTGSEEENDSKYEMERYQMVKDLRDHILSGGGGAAERISASKCRRLDHHRPNLTTS
ncbi:myosin-3-like [Impatiens glandulifera]|uniref:myosin-3-like n=1 Tax=Impatiens glandulifera TaxID=253017 RepID=UPI001FB0D1BA|nr:myosin-3-like [Impatiens glandulifera]